MKLSFKKGKVATGLMATAEPYATTFIRGDGVCIGQIAPPSRFGRDQQKWSVSILVGTEKDWRWATLKFRSDTEAEAREFVKKNFDTLQEKFSIYKLENYEPWA